MSFSLWTQMIYAQKRKEKKGKKIVKKRVFSSENFDAYSPAINFRDTSSSTDIFPILIYTSEFTCLTSIHLAWHHIRVALPVVDTFVLVKKLSLSSLSLSHSLTLSHTILVSLYASCKCSWNLPRIRSGLHVSDG